MENPPPPPPELEVYYLGKVITELTREELIEALRYCVRENGILTNRWQEAEKSKMEWMCISSKLKFGHL